MSDKISLADNLHYLHENDIDINNREIYLVSTVDYVTGAGIEETEQPGVEYIQANKFLANLNTLTNLSEEPITIHQSTCGGDWHFGMQIYDAVKTCPCHIKIINYTEARSMSSLFFLAADERQMHKHSIFMFHMGSMALGGTVKQFKTEVVQLDKATEQMLDIYVEVMKSNGCMKRRSKKVIREWLISEMDRKEECYLSAEQAVKYGFADSIIGVD
jgi:ATP-dependent protease ClpP protease subunit